MRLLALTGVVAIALVGAGVAEAAVRPNPAFNADNTLTPDAWEVIQNPAVHPPPAPSTSLTQTQADSFLERVRRRARVMPPLRTIFTGAMLARSTPWAVAAYFSGTGYLGAYRVLTDDESTLSDANATVGSVQIKTKSWRYFTAGQNLGTNPNQNAPEDGWYLRFIINNGTEYGGWPDSGGDSALLQARYPYITLLPGTSNWYFGFMEDADYEARFGSKPSNVTEYNTYDAGDQITYSSAQPTLDGDDEAAAAATYGTPGTQTQLQEDAEETLIHAIDDGWSPDESDGLLALLAPGLGETYSAYIARLRAAGWLGEALVTELAADALDETVGPNAISSVRVLTTPTASTIERPWPTPAPRITPETNLRFIVNPASAPALPGTGTPVEIIPPTTTVPAAPALDFGPLTDIDWGCKFPYGFICYAVDFSEQFNVAADAPVFTFDMEMDVALGSFDLGTYEVDLEVMDAWMALWRDILSVVMVVGAIYFVATRMLGFKAGGDPGAAMDDVL